MPPFTATSKHVKPFVLVPVKESDIGAKNPCQDDWLEKVSDRQEGAKPQKHKPKHKHNFVQRALESSTRHHTKVEEAEKDAKDVYDEHSYKDELQKYIAESSANLLYDDDEPLHSSDEDTSDEDSDPVSISPRNTEVIDYSASIVSISSDKTVDEYVEPPVEVPRSHRAQDRQGGVLVAGHRVTFTYWAFKRQMHHLGRLGPLPERGEAELSGDFAQEMSVGIYTGKIVEL